jgi:hypothetical protein
MAIESQADIQLTNLNPARQVKDKKESEGSSECSSDGDENSDEDFEDF